MVHLKKSNYFVLCSFVFLLIILLLSIPSVSSVQMDGIKDSYNSMETLITRISGNFQEPILENNIQFYRISEGVGLVDVPMEFSFERVGGNTWLYALLPDVDNSTNYSLRIEGVSYMKGPDVVDEDIVRNFSVKDKLASVSVEPGLVVANNSFEIKVQNLESSELTLSADIGYYDEGFVTKEESKGDFWSSFFGSGTGSGDSVKIDNGTQVTLDSGEIEDIEFNVENVENDVVKTLHFSGGETSYEIPVYVYGKEKTKEKDEEQEENISLKVSPGKINVSMTTNNRRIRELSIINTGNVEINNISLLVPDTIGEYLDFSKKNISELEVNSSFNLKIFINSSNEEKHISDQLRVKYDGDNFAYSMIYLGFIKDYVSDNGNESNYNYSEGTDYTNVSEYNPVEDNTSYGGSGEDDGGDVGFYIGILIIIGVIGFLAWFFFKKYKKAGNKKPGLSKALDKVKSSKK